MKIGMFDSGIGGLTVLHAALKILPDEAYFYYADTDNVPYGEKTIEQIREYSGKAIEFLMEKDCDAVVIACNTATAAAAEYLRKKYPIPIIGIEPAVKPAVEHNGGKRILVIATAVTAREKKLEDLISRVDNEGLVDVKALPELVGFAEHGEFDSPAVNACLRKEFGSADLKQYGTLVFGCTHFNHFRHALEKIMDPGTLMIDGSAGTARNLKKMLNEKGLASEGKREIHYYRSGREVNDSGTLAFYESVMAHLEEGED